MSTTAAAGPDLSAMTLSEARMWLAGQLRRHLAGEQADPRAEITAMRRTVRAVLYGQRTALVFEVPRFAPCPEWAWLELAGSVRSWCGSRYADGHLSHKEAWRQAVWLPADMKGTCDVLHADDLTLALLADGWRITRWGRTGPSEFSASRQGTS